jgi:hypothetical protein
MILYNIAIKIERQNNDNLRKIVEDKDEDK